MLEMLTDNSQILVLAMFAKVKSSGLLSQTEPACSKFQKVNFFHVEKQWLNNAKFTTTIQSLISSGPAITSPRYVTETSQY